MIMAHTASHDTTLLSETIWVFSPQPGSVLLTQWRAELVTSETVRNVCMHLFPAVGESRGSGTAETQR